MLSREAILAFKDERIGRVEVSEMGGEVCVASLTVAEADQLKAISSGDVPAVTKVVILGACDEEGKRLFSDKDAAALSKLPASALGKVANAVLAHNGLGGGEEAKND